MCAGVVVGVHADYLLSDERVPSSLTSSCPLQQSNRRLALQILYVIGEPLGMPQIQEPTQADIDKWHQKYCDEVTRIFDTYKERVPMYKHKKLIIV